uniref:odorant receptor 13a-like n=1 Tax=Osmia lignaria TaxID=473952 RepID=UPI001478A35A|nr:odorant receptor 13a-like [Osmia lignaria]
MLGTGYPMFNEQIMYNYILVNIGKDASERTLIFPMWLDESWNETPYFEIEYVIQALSSFQAGISFLCFDNIFCIMCLHAAGQFRILQYRMTNIHEVQNAPEDNKNVNKNVLYLSEICLGAFRDCIRQHQALIDFCKLIDEVFREIMLMQVLIFSMLMCLTGYQTFLVSIHPENLLCCSSMTHASVSVTSAVYASPWTDLSMDKFGKMIRKDVQFVIMRSSRACHINAWRFFPISLETFTKIMSTAMSYFTILRQNTLDTANT